MNAPKKRWLAAGRKNKKGHQRWADEQRRTRETAMGKMIALVIAACLVTMSAEAGTTCIPTDVEIKGVRKITQPGPFVFIVGEATNRCKASVQAIITLTLRNDGGEIVDVIDWVGMEHGPIAPGEIYAFKAVTFAPEADTASKIESAVRIHR
jgi:hypothetical protein